MTAMTEKKILSVDELCQWLEVEKARCLALPLNNPEHWTGFEYDKAHHGFDIRWGGYHYFIELSRIRSPLELLKWIDHIAHKEWPGTTPIRIHRFIQAACARIGWNLHASEPIHSKEQARALMTPALRWSILEHDGHACQSCGLTPAMGAVLHVDHIVCVSNGGQTVASNLRTLCMSCNFGRK